MEAYASLNNDSQLTLVDATAHGVPYTVISLKRDDMKNTIILAEDESVLYTVDTEKIANAHTIVYRGQTQTVVAEVKRKELREDRIKFGTDRSMKMSKWLHGKNGKWTDFPVSFEWESKLYTWRTNSSRQIALYEDSDPDTAIAWFQTSKRSVLEGEPVIYRALLALQRDGVAVLDVVVVSLLVVEQGLRWRETRYKNADGRAAFKVYF